MTDFAGLGLNSALVETLTRIEYTQPTPIQEQTIPLVLQGKDVLGTAQTGTGKTGAFAIPTIEFLMKSPRGSALIMTPTRELAAQVQAVIKQMLQGQKSVKTALLIGGEPMPKQLSQLRMKPRIIIGTPGRINDHLTRGSLMLHDAGLLVLDETDRMLDMGFGIQIDQILKFMPKQRQTLLFSATLPPEIVRISKKYLNNPERIEVGQASRPALNIDHKMEKATDAEKYPKLLDELDEREGSVIIFVKTKRGADKLAVKLRKAEHQAEAIHGDLRQSQRDRVIKAFRQKRYRVLVATDVAARGLDIPHIEHVINYDLPQCAEDYIHRIGRTARAGAKGAALCYVSPADRGMWRAISRLLDPSAKPEADNDDYQERRGGNNRRGRNQGHRGKRNEGSFGGKRQGQRPAFASRDERRSSAGRQSEVGGEFSPRKPEFKEKPFKEPRQQDEFRGEQRQSRGDYAEQRSQKPSKPKRFQSDEPRGERRERKFERGDRNERPRRDDRPRRDNSQFSGNKGRRQKPAHFSHDDQNAPNFMEKPFKERSFRADDQGMFKKKDGEARRAQPRNDRNKCQSPKNVTRYDGPGSSYFRPSNDGNGNRAPRRDRDVDGNRAPRGERAHNGSSKPKSFKRKPRHAQQGNKRFNDRKNSPKKDNFAA